jgi:phosphoribosylaminoimidazole carboxylase (NCAIR synthetase)
VHWYFNQLYNSIRSLIHNLGHWTLNNRECDSFNDKL